MKCPHCGYKNGWEFDTDTLNGEKIEGKDGDFFSLQIEMERKQYYELERKELFACPSCKKTFID